MTLPGGVELMVGLLLLAAGVALPIWAALDAARRSDATFAAAGQHRVLWIVLPLAVLAAGLGWAAALVYFLAIRPKVAAAP